MTEFDALVLIRTTQKNREIETLDLPIFLRMQLENFACVIGKATAFTAL